MELSAGDTISINRHYVIGRVGFSWQFGGGKLW